MEKTGVPTIQKTIREERAAVEKEIANRRKLREAARETARENRNWVEIDFARRRVLRDSFAQERIDLFLNPAHPEPVISIRPTKGGGKPHIAIVEPIGPQEVPLPDEYNFAIPVQGLSETTDPAERLRLIAQELPAFIERFEYTQKVPIRIFNDTNDYDRNEPAAEITFEGSVPEVKVDESKLAPFYTTPEGN